MSGSSPAEPRLRRAGIVQRLGARPARIGIGRADALRVARDPMLVLLSLAPLALAAALRLTRGRVAAMVAPHVDVDVALTALTALLLLLTPMMFGFVLGLLILDERDDGVLQAVAVTRLGTNGFLRARMLMPVLWSGAAALLLAPLAGLVHIPPAILLSGAFMAALQAPLLALFLGAFAANKVAGMALAKVGSLLIGAGALGALAPHPWRWLAAPIPHFWLVDTMLTERAPAAFTAAAGAGVTGHLAVLLALAALSARRAG